MNVEDVIQIRIAEAARRIEAARKRRAEREAARKAGLAKRHAAKLHNLAAREPDPPAPPDDTPGEGDVPCFPHARAREACGESFRATNQPPLDEAPEVA